MSKFRKKPVVIEAEQFSGTVAEVAEKVARLGLVRRPRLNPGKGGGGSLFAIATLEGDMEVRLGDWVITGVKGERYPCKPDIFAATYEAIDVGAKP